MLTACQTFGIQAVINGLMGSETMTDPHAFSYCMFWNIVTCSKVIARYSHASMAIRNHKPASQTCTDPVHNRCIVCWHRNDHLAWCACNGSTWCYLGSTYILDLGLPAAFQVEPVWWNTAESNSSRRNRKHHLASCFLHKLSKQTLWTRLCKTYKRVKPNSLQIWLERNWRGSVAQKLHL